MDVRQTIFRYKLYHLAFWLLLAVVWYYLRFQDYASTGEAIAVTAVKVFDLALMIYIANYLLIPRLLYKKMYVVFALSFIAMIVVSSIIKMYVVGSIIHSPVDWKDAKTTIYNNFIPHFFLVLAGMAFKLMIDYNQMQRRLAEIAKEKAETELSFLKSQINPHFLFNSLNAVYFLIDKNNKDARQALHKFSEMLRYQLYEMKGERIPIEKEIAYLKDYVAMQQLRIENCQVQLNVDNNIDGFFIEPLLLVPFVENSFKHLSHYDNEKPNEIRIDLLKQDGEMNFNIRNTTEDKPTTEAKQNGGIGLGNVKRRLELLYPQKHHLQISTAEGWFDVQLKIKMD